MTSSYRVLVATAALFLTGAILTGPVQAQGRGRQQQKQHGQAQARQQARQPAPQARQQASSRQDQQRRIDQERQRETAYRGTLDRQVSAAGRRAAQLEQQRRTAQVAAQQRYLGDLRAQQRRLQANRDYAHDRGVLAPPAYRYRRGGVVFVTSTYGAELLRQAVRYGYEEGYRVGQADRMDRVRFDYGESFAYLDANWGYEGRYVPEADYNFYFREGFRRGYEDGYYQRYQYGYVVHGAPAILGAILTGVLSLTPIR